MFAVMCVWYFDFGKIGTDRRAASHAAGQSSVCRAPWRGIGTIGGAEMYRLRRLCRTLSDRSDFRGTANANGFDTMYFLYGLYCGLSRAGKVFARAGSEDVV